MWSSMHARRRTKEGKPMIAPQTPDSQNQAGGTWLVRRQDENGTQFGVQGGLSKEEADNLVSKLEQRGHKQSYWAEPEPGTRRA
jgi:hypothetical protein